MDKRVADMTEAERERKRERERARYAANCVAIRERNRAYREANLEAARERDRAYREANREANREASRERDRAYYAANLQARREAARAYYVANLEAQREAARARYEANRDARRARNRAYREANPGAGGAAVQRRRARLRDSSSPGVTVAEWEAICAGYDFSCRGCGRSDLPLTRDHDIPISKGGRDEPSNVYPMCTPCNSSKGALTFNEWVLRRATSSRPPKRRELNCDDIV